MDSTICLWLSCLISLPAILLTFFVFVLKKIINTSFTPTVPALNTSSLSTSPAARSDQYEVFLSFRGKDTRTGFTDHLHNGLKDAGIDTFLDDDELHIGEEIGPELLNAIENSKISIPVLSKDYASSNWCLIELTKMVQCRRTLSHIILPIFYDVELSDVKKQAGSYEKAFQEHQKNFDSATVEEWKKALRKVGRLKGWEVKNRHETKLIHEVISRVLEEVRGNSVVENECLVGIEDHVEEMMKLLSVNSKDVRIVGIHGMGGIGKTTIAKVIYHQLSQHFVSCCFLPDVRETAQHKGIVYLQNQLISNILKRRCLDVSTMDEGINAIKKRFSKKKVLVVIDDVNYKIHLHALVGKCDWFGSGSRIIVTTRDKEILNPTEVNWTYEPKELDSNQSIRLFSWNAFRRVHPPKDYHTLSRNVVSTTGGLPLALEVIGSFLSGKGKEVWNDTLKKLKRMPDGHVQKKLRISYEALEYEQQQIFLDIACLFIGVDKRIAFHMWDDCNFYPENGIEVLRHMSLVKIGNNNELMMHDQVRDLGRDIVRQENFMDPGKRSRVWFHKEAFDILESLTGTRKIEALFVDFGLESQVARCLTNEEFANLSNLRFLQVGNAKLDGDFKRLLLKLRWLHWNGCPEIFRPTNFHLKNLVILDLSRSEEVTEAWEGWNHIKLARKLKVLNLTSCKYMVRTPDFSAYATLERLILEGCENLVHIDPSIGYLKSLVFLNVKNCAKLNRLPPEFDYVEALTELLIDRTSIKEVPIGRGVLKKLEILSATSCCLLTQISTSVGYLTSLSDLTLDYSPITELPNSIGSLVKLRRLSLSNCELKELPESIGKLESLIEMCLSGEKFRQLPDSIGNLKSLRILKIKCQNLKEIRSLGRLKSLEFLVVSCCISLETLPDLSNLKLLEKLKLKGCKKLHEIKGLKGLKSLKMLDFSLCTALEGIHDLSNSEMLVELNLYDCQKLHKIECLKALKSLEMLDLSGCTTLERIPDLSNMKMLKKLNFYNCQKLHEIEGLKDLKSLKMLNLSSCTALERLPDLSKMEMLEKLKFCSCQKLHEIEGLKDLKSLKVLDLNGCTGLERLQDLSNSELLEELYLYNCLKLHEIEGLEALKSLMMLDLSGCTALERLPDLSNLERLEELKLAGCQMLQEIEGLTSSKSLKMLDLSGCTALERLPDLSNGEMLEELKLAGCLKLHEIEGLKALKSLKMMDLSGCIALERLPDVLNNEMLEELKLTGCKMLHEIDGIMSLKSLKMLNLSGCTMLERLPDISNMEKLDELKLIGCLKLHEIEGLKALKSLKMMDLSGCRVLERLPDLSKMKMLEELKLVGCEKLHEIKGLEALKSLKKLDLSGCIAFERSPNLLNNSLSTSPPAEWDYEVFLSFRSEDTSKTFTDYLYTDLGEAGIHAFRDNYELRVGEKIGSDLLKAIQHSKISIPVFSKHYASSKWCLLELTQMVECKRAFGQMILPIFYDVEPSDVKHQTGSYEKAFQEHKKKYDSTTVKGWKKALREIGELSGWNVKNRPQGELVKEVVSKVWGELRRNYSLVVNETLVGIGHHVEEMLKLLSVNSSDVRIVGIYGMGGIGKTTIAKVIYNQLSRHFDSRCFLADVRETAQHKGLVHLQNQLISNILTQRCVDISTVDEGTNVIKERFSGKKVLVVVDDADHRDHLQALAIAGKLDWFGSGSRIIVTTRNKEILNLTKVNWWIYEPKELDFNQSLQLFSRHAFRTDRPPQYYDILSKDVVFTAGGLPLVLEIIGSFLSGKGKEAWEGTLKQLERIPNNIVLHKLMISFRALENAQKNIFLDIACLFAGVDRRIAFHMWNDCGFYPEHEIEVLRLMSLVKIGDNNELMMHALLRDLGREFVRQESVKDPGNRSRVWSQEEANDILNHHMGTEQIEALSVDFELESQACCLTNEEFAHLPNLRFLQIDFANLDGDFKGLLSELRWLRWNGCPQIFSPTNFHLKNLVILDLSRSKVTEDWEGWNYIKIATKLKVLNLTGCADMVRTPDFSAYASLERLILEDCKNLVHIDPSIRHLKSLVFLNVKNCAKLNRLPQEFDYLEASMELLIDGTSIQEVSIGGGVMKKLQGVRF